MPWPGSSQSWLGWRWWMFCSLISTPFRPLGTHHLIIPDVGSCGAQETLDTGLSSSKSARKFWRTRPLQQLLSCLSAVAGVTWDTSSKDVCQYRTLNVGTYHAKSFSHKEITTPCPGQHKKFQECTLPGLTHHQMAFDAEPGDLLWRQGCWAWADNLMAGLQWSVPILTEYCSCTRNFGSVQHHAQLNCRCFAMRE